MTAWRVCCRFQGCGKCLREAAWAGRMCLEAVIHGCPEPWLWAQGEAERRHCRNMGQRQSGIRAQVEHWEPVSSDQNSPTLPHCCHLAMFRLGIRQWVHPLAKVESSEPSHIPQIYQPVEYLMYSKHNRVSRQAGQPTIFTNTAKKEQKASEFGG